MGKLFIILEENTSTVIPKVGGNKGVGYSRTEYTAIHSNPNNYVLSNFQLLNDNEKDESFITHEGNRYKLIQASSYYFGSLEHAIDKYLSMATKEPSEDIYTVKELCQHLTKQILTKEELIETWLPTIKLAKEVEKKVLDY